MALQIIDYSKAPLLDSPFKNLLEDVLKGYKMQQEPAKMKQESTERELANKLKGLDVEHKPKEYELNDKQKELTNALSSKALEHYEEKFGLEKQLKQAQINKANRPTSGVGAKANGKLANFMVSHPDATQAQITEFADTLSKAELDHLRQTTERSKDITSGAAFDKLPVDEKKRAVGLTTAMGLDTVEGTQLLRSGKTLEQIAKDRGKNLEDLIPVYPLGTENVKQLQRRTGFVNEIKNLEKNLAGAMGEYQNKIMGYSLDQVADALKGDNPDKQGKVLAARALQPELAALRLKVAGGNIGIEAINELKSKSLGDLKILEGLVDKPTYLAMQKYMTTWLEQATNEFQRTMEDYGRLKTRQQKYAEAESGMGSDPLGLR